MQSITDILYKHNTDKVGHHSYGHVYEQYFNELRNQKIRICEIGIDKGFSINAWLEIFPYGEVVGIDRKVDQKLIDHYNNTPRCSAYKSNAYTSSTWSDLGDFDIIIDDGSHKPSHQTWVAGFLMNRCKLLFIEDIKKQFVKRVTGIKWSRHAKVFNMATTQIPDNIIAVW